MHTCVHVCVRVPVGMEQGGLLQGFAPARVPFGGWLLTDSLSWRETGQLSGGTRMDRLGSGVVDGMAGCE